MAQYADITKIVSPQAAVAGRRVDIECHIKNLYSATIGIMVGGALEYGVSPWPGITFPESSVNVAAGQTHIFHGYFTMPARDVTIHAYSYYYAGVWYPDDEKTKKVTAWIPLASTTLLVKEVPVVTGWIPLASTSLAVKEAMVGGWIPLVSTTLLVKQAMVGGWIPLASVSLLVKKGIVGGWIPLASTSLSVKAGAVAGEDVFQGDLVVVFSKHKS